MTEGPTEVTAAPNCPWEQPPTHVLKDIGYCHKCFDAKPAEG
jgi:hypothetical protein